MMRAGLIPAHAGKTVSISGVRSEYWAHPRSRGENARFVGLGVHGMGSSPLTRGKRDFGAMCAALGGLIPAHAGKTGGPGAGGLGTGAHPRSRGENWDNVLYPLFDLGSSPLTRGKLNFRQGQISAFGLIPAHAGKTGRTTSRR